MSEVTKIRLKHVYEAFFVYMDEANPKYAQEYATYTHEGNPHLIGETTLK
jgi:hypothetical protein